MENNIKFEESACFFSKHTYLLYFSAALFYIEPSIPFEFGGTGNKFYSHKKKWPNKVEAWYIIISVFLKATTLWGCVPDSVHLALHAYCGDKFPYSGKGGEFCPRTSPGFQDHCFATQCSMCKHVTKTFIVKSDNAQLQACTYSMRPPQYQCNLTYLRAIQKWGWHNNVFLEATALWSCVPDSICPIVRA